MMRCGGILLHKYHPRFENELTTLHAESSTLDASGVGKELTRTDNPGTCFFGA